VMGRHYGFLAGEGGRTQEGTRSDE
jgi:hypothetical protein